MSPVDTDVTCFTCGPTTLEKHPRIEGQVRCSNCKEHYPFTGTRTMIEEFEAKHPEAMQRAVRESLKEPDYIVVELTEEEFHSAARRGLAALGLTYAELHDQAKSRNFVHSKANTVWSVIGGTLPYDFE